MKHTRNWPIVAIVVGASVVVVVLAWASSLLASLCFIVTWFIVAGACVAALVRPNRSATFWRGFAAFAFVYFSGTVLISDLETTIRQFTGATPYRAHLATSYFLAWAYDATGAPEIWTSGGTRIPALHLLKISRRQVPASLDISRYERFMCVGQCAFSLMMGLCGAWLATHLSQLNGPVH